ncbi:hypothetical protein [Actinomadura sp. 7K534]|uniref:hypothetical protein n=1 Tax=Actinomadura sp. 7K534 TaxID=2530366 RepID=UPI00105109DF|nr:hypothetical protein [Actinomadura sp. 7K534]TDB89102.1 hypothetical protein E1266_30240 [Actinomadura sp. 7K534]
MSVAADDEPLEGDIGPAADAGASRTAGAPAPRKADAAEELRRYEAEREERRRRTNALSGRITTALAALLLAFLAYDSARTALTARSRGDDWIYPPLVIAGICTIALVTLLAWAVRRVK